MARALYRKEKYVTNKFQMGKDTFTGEQCTRCAWPIVIRDGASFTYNVCRNVNCQTGKVRTDGNEQSAYSPIFYWQFRKFSHERDEYKAWRKARRKAKRADA